MSNLNLLPGNYNVNISNQNYDGVNVNPQKSKGVGDEKLTLAGQTKTDYLKLAVGEREKQLEKLGLLENEDGKVLLKGNIIAYDKEKITMEEEEKNSQLNGECETCAN